MSDPVEVLECVLASHLVPADLVEHIITCRLTGAVTGRALRNPALTVDQLTGLLTTSGEISQFHLTVFVLAMDQRGRAAEALQFVNRSFPGRLAPAAHALGAQLDPDVLLTALAEHPTWPESWPGALDEINHHRARRLLDVAPDAALTLLAEDDLDDDSKIALLARRLQQEADRQPRTDPMFLAAQRSDNLAIQCAAVRTARCIEDLAPILAMWDQRWSQMTAKQRAIATSALTAGSKHLDVTSGHEQEFVSNLTNLPLLAMVTTTVPGRWTHTHARLAHDLLVPALAGHVKVTLATRTHLGDILTRPGNHRAAAKAWEELNVPPAPGMEKLEQALPTTERIKATRWEAIRASATLDSVPEMILAHLGDGPDRWATAHAALPADLSDVTVGEILARIATTTQIG